MSIEHCPRCSARVRVPVMAEPDSWVRCPRCRMESQLSEMLAAEPPELELIEGPSAAVPAYAPALAGVGAEGEDMNDFNVTSGDTLVVDEDSPTLPLGGISMDDNLLDEGVGTMGASIGRAAKSEDDELFGFDDNPDVESLGGSDSLRTTSEDGKYIDVPADGDEEFNLSDEPSSDFGKPTGAVPAMGAGFGAIPTTPPRRKKKTSMVATLIGVAGGGVLGILIAYWGILMWALKKDPFDIAKQLPEGMQMLVPEALQNKKPVASNNTPPAEENTDNSSNSAIIPNENNVPMDPGTNPPMNNPADPGTPAENKTPENPADPLDPLASGIGDLKPPADPVKPAADPNDPFAIGPKPEMPVKPEVTTPADPLDPLASPLTPAKPEVTNPAPADPLDPLSNPLKPEMPAKPEVAAKPEVTTPDPLDPLTPKPADPLTAKPTDPLDPLTPMPADPLAAPAQPKVSEPLMLASATFAPADLDQRLTEATASYTALAQKPEDGGTQIASYRALSRLGEVAGQLKSLGDTPENKEEHLKALQAASKKLADDASVASLAKWTATWLKADPAKRMNDGIFLHGTLGKSEPAGKFQRTTLDVPGGDQKLIVVSEYPLIPSADGKVTILGIIVNKPTEQIPGYPGPEERVIWVSVGEMEKPAAAPAGDAGTPPAPAPMPAPATTPSDDPFGLK